MIYIILSIMFFTGLIVYIIYLNRNKIQTFLEDEVWKMQKTTSDYALI